MPSHQARQNRRVEHETRPLFTPTVAAPSGEVIQREATSDAGQNIAASLENTGTGQGLEGSTRSFLEPKFGHNFANVKIHADGHADQMSKAVNARAFTTGQDVFFRQGEYNPNSSEGMHLLAHELTHTIQQSRGSVSGTSIGDGLAISDPNDAFEQEASAAANSVARGERVHVGMASGGVVQRKADSSVDLMPLVLQRDPNPAPPAAPAPSTGTGVKNTFETPPFKVPHEATSLGPVKMQAEIKAELSFDQPTQASSSSDPGAPTQARAGVTASPTGGVGYQAEVQKEFQRRSEGALAGWKPTIKGGGKVTSNGGEIGIEGAIERDFLAGTVLSQTIKFTILGVDLKENDITFVGMSYTVALAKKFKAEFMPGIEVEVKGGIEFKFTPDWIAIGKWIAERLAVSAGEAVVVDGAAVAGSAAAVIAPVGAAALIIAGFIQTGKNIDASRAAIGTAVRLRKQAKDFAKAYAGKLTGGSGSGPGADAAEQKIKEYRIVSLKERAEACNDLREKNGGYQKIYTDILTALRPKLFAQAVAEFETNYQTQFGILESIGEDWGMRGVFRKDMRMILFADDE
jgi:plasmid stability protein